MTKPQPKRARAANKDLEKLLRKIQRALPDGAYITGGGSRHYKIIVPGKGMVIVSASASDIRALKHLRRDVSDVFDIQL